MVGAIGFEPTTPCAQGRCATRLRYAPTLLIINDEAFSFVAVAEGTGLIIVPFDIRRHAGSSGKV